MADMNVPPLTTGAVARDFNIPPFTTGTRPGGVICRGCEDLCAALDSRGLCVLCAKALDRVERVGPVISMEEALASMDDEGESDAAPTTGDGGTQ